MSYKYLFDLKKFYFLSFIFLFQQIFFIENLQANNSKINIDNELKIVKKSLNEQNNFIENQYLLDTGDTIYINNIGIEIFNRTNTIDLDGYIDLPEINKVYARNKTLTELKNEIIEKYEEYIISPNIKLKIISYRPVNVSIIGEVSRPGLYTLNYDEIKDAPLINPGLTNNFESSIKFKNPPRIFNLLKKSKGFTNYADLSKLRVIRNFSENGIIKKIETELNIFELILNGDQSQNIRLKDKDIIIVPKSSQIIKDQILKISKSNISDGEITIYLTGNIVKKGPSKLKAGSSLNQAIFINGGKELLSGKIEFIRFNNDGSAKREVFNYKKNALINTKYNPILMDGDIINIKRSPYNYGKDIINDVLRPITDIYTIIKILD